MMWKFFVAATLCAVTIAAPTAATTPTAATNNTQLQTPRSPEQEACTLAIIEHDCKSVSERPSEVCDKKCNCINNYHYCLTKQALCAATDPRVVEVVAQGESNEECDWIWKDPENLPVDDEQFLQDVVSVTSTCSIIGSLYIMLHLYMGAGASKFELRQKLLFVLAICDFFSAVFFFLGVYTISLAERGVPGTLTHKDPSWNCKIQGWLVSISNLSSVVWGMCIAHNTFASIVQGKAPDSLDKFWNKYLIGTFVFALFLSSIMLGLGKTGDNDFCCWIKRSSYRFWGFLLEVCIALVINLVCLFKVNTAMAARLAQAGVKQDRDAQLITLRSLEYIAVFVIVWVFCAVNRVCGLFLGADKQFWHILLEALFVPTRGMFNAIVYSNVLDPLVERCIVKPNKETDDGKGEEDADENYVDPNLKPTKHTANVWCTTYNMGEKDLSPEEIKRWIPPGKDIYAIGAQECLYPHLTGPKILAHLEESSGGDAGNIAKILQQAVANNTDSVRNKKTKKTVNHEREQMKKTFDKYDGDSSGDIDKKEFEQLLRHVGSYESDEAFERIWSNLNVEHEKDGVSFNEFYDLVSTEKKGIWTKYEIKIGSDQTALGYHGFIILFLFVKTSWVRKGIFKPRNMNASLARGIDLGVATAANKGASGVSFDVYNTSMAFFTCHMRSDKKGANRFEDRNEDARGILRDLEINVDQLGFDAHLTTHHFFFFGDFNYRCYPTAQEFMPKLAKAFTTDDDADWWDMLTYDEMNIARKQGKVFHDFTEPNIHFAPTFRRNRDEAGYIHDYTDEKKLFEGYSCEVQEHNGDTTYRTPSWTDRLVWHSFSDLKQDVRCLKYDQIESLRVSDHNPVVIDLEIDCYEVPKELDVVEKYDIVLSDIKFEPKPERELPFTREFVGDSLNFNKEMKEKNPPTQFMEQLDLVDDLVVHFPLLCEDPKAQRRKLEAVAAAMRGETIESGMLTIPWKQFKENKNTIELNSVDVVWHRGMHLLIKFQTARALPGMQEAESDEEANENTSLNPKKKKKKKGKKDEKPQKSRLAQVCLCLADSNSGPKKRLMKRFSETLTSGAREIGTITGTLQVKPKLSAEGIDDLHKEFEETTRECDRLRRENRLLQHATGSVSESSHPVQWHNDF